MKKYLFFFLFLFVSYVGFSQKGLSYQAVILDPAKIEIPGQDISGQPLVNGDVWLKFSIYNGSTLQFEEVHKTKTDNYGLVNLLIGSVSSASFNSLVWDSSQKSLYVYVSFNQGSSYTKISDQKLNYNPYALFAETAGKLSSVLPIANGGTGATTAADARTNLGLDQVNNTSDAAKPVSLATKAALDLKANTTDMNTALALKANATDVAAGLASKANTSDVNASLDLKANLLDVTAALAAKADTGTIKTYVDTRLASGNFTSTQGATATISDADASTKGKIQLAGDLSGTADAPTVPSLALKANAADVTSLTTTVNANTASITANSSEIALKAPIASPTFTGTVSGITKSMIGLGYVDNTHDADKPISTANQAALDLKANSTDVTTALNLKANASDVTSALNLKANAADLTSGLALKLDANQKGIANGIATLNSSGIIPSSQLPPVTISSTSVVASDADMIGLSSATVGSIAIRTDLNKNYVLSATPASTLGNWVELLTPAAPVQTVNGYSGAVNLSKSDLGLGNVDNTSDASKPVSTATQTALNLKLDANKVGAASGVASLNALGKIPTDQIPAISFSSVKVLGSQVDMLALSSAVIGSVVIRTDVNKNYVLSALPATTLGNWIELLTPAPPVQTVNGMTGSVSLTKTDLNLGNVDNTSDASKPISTATQTALNLKANSADITSALALKAALASPTFTGTVTTSAINTGAISATSITAPTYASTPKALTYTGSIINWNPTQGLNAAITLTQNSTLSFATAPPVGSYGTVVLTQDGTGNRTLTLPSITGVTNKVLGSTSTTTVALSTAANSKDILNFYYDGTNCYWNIGQGYGTSGGGSNATNLATGVTGTLAVANGGTGATTLTGILKGNGTGALTAASAGTDYQAPITITTSGTGAATLSGTTLNIPIPSAYTLPTSSASTLGGIKVGNNLSIDGSGFLSANINAGSISGTVAVANGGTGATSLTGLVKGNGTGAMTAATAGTDYITPNTAITGATKTKITYDNKGLVTSGTDATTADISPSTNRNYVTDLQAGVISNTSGVNTGDETTSTIKTKLSIATLSGSNTGDQTINLTGDITGTGTGTFTTTIGNSKVINSMLAGNITSDKLVGTDLATVGTITTGIWSGTTISVAKGGTGATTQQAAINSLTGTQSSGKYLRSDGTNATLTTIQSGDVPTLNQNTTGNAATATLAGNITATSNSTLTSLTNLNTVGTITSGTISLTTNISTSGTLTAGSVTYPNTHGTVNQVLTTIGSGTLTWTTPSSGSSNTHSVGESYGGGVIFYTWDNGAHGLIVSLTDQCCNSSTIGYFSAGTSTNTLAYNGSGGALTGNQTNYTTITGGGVGAGRKNTLLILASQGLGNGVKYAARYANEYSISSNGVLYDDWYLGSVDEYHLLANNYDQVLANNSFTALNGPDKDYWTSTEIDLDNAFSVYIRTNSDTSHIFDVFPNPKNNFTNAGYGNVRAIRSF